MSECIGKSKVSETIWDWQESSTYQKKAKPPFIISLITLLVGWTIASLLFYFGHVLIALLTCCVSLVVFLIGQFFPNLYFYVEFFLQKFSGIVGIIFTWMLLVPFFYVFFPFGRLMQLIKKKDKMHRIFDLDVVSYWKKCEKKSSIDNYKRQS
jgi:hypothetical protein